MTPPQFSVLDMQDNGNGTFTLLKPLVFTSRTLGVLVVPAGFLTDLASIPQVFQSFLSKIGPYDEPAVVHDYLYATQPCTRTLADRTLREGMQDAGVKAWQVFVIYWAVRIGGGPIWADHQYQHARLRVQRAMRRT